LGRGIARAFAEAGAPVVAVARTGPALAELATTSSNIRIEVADAADATVAWSLLDQYEPEVLILVAGANPVMRPLSTRRGRGSPSTVTPTSSTSIARPADLRRRRGSGAVSGGR
jgi:NAD(P)-dependent dehydrogenase (short-subunit alcohol dehydrogenase family)